MNPSTPSTGCRQLSSSLKERLKRCGRYHNSPVSTASSVTPISLMSSATTAPHDQATPNRKRLSSSPLRCKVPNKRQILQCRESGEEDCHSTIPGKPSQHVDKEAAGETVDEDQNSDQLCMDTVNLESQNELQDPALNVTSKGSVTVIPDKTEPEIKNVLTDIDRNKVGKESNKVPIEIEESKFCPKEAKDESIQECDSTVVCLEEAGQDKVASSEDATTAMDQEARRKVVLKELQLKQETLRQLKMVQMYRTKNNLEDLQVLIDKWRGVVQLALPDLHVEMSATSESKPSLTQLVDHLGIPHDLVEYDPEEETFRT